jgi:hypothetical protein
MWKKLFGVSDDTPAPAQARPAMAAVPPMINAGGSAKVRQMQYRLDAIRRYRAQAGERGRMLSRTKDAELAIEEQLLSAKLARAAREN